ncbi:hypothetical protein [Brevundimonas sp.]|uniref:hypothetical protein n=1 Tax=Brevundimonas sp. TaxID=1871086 RepID=UPI001A1B0CE9|nr:hypothetical protein [Brevundimonas sp.]MBJ7486409.1 hypothetical protein [Brevundimonas sp.]
MTGALVAAVLGLLAWLIWSGSGKAAPLSGRVAVLGVLVAPAIVLIAIGSAVLIDRGGGQTARFGQIRMTLESLDLGGRGDRLTIGGGPEDGLVVEGATAGLASLRPMGGSGGAAAQGVAELIVRPPAAADDGVSVVSVDKEFVGSEPFPRGSALCVGTCDGPGARWRVLSRSGAVRFVAGRLDAEGRVVAAEDRVDAGETFPRREPFPFIAAPRPWRASQAVYPVERYLEADAAAGRLRSVLYQQGGWRGADWRLLALDPQLWVALPGEAPRRVEGGANRSNGRTVEVPSGSTVTIWDVRTYGFSQGGQPAGRLQERRALVVEGQGRGVSVRLQTPATEVVATCPTNGRLTTADIRYPILGGPVAAGLDQNPTLPRAADCARFLSSVIKGEGGVAPTFTMARFGAPWSLVVLILAWTGGVLWLQRGVWTDRAVHWSIYCVFQTLLALRFVIAVSGAGADPETLAPGRLIGEAAIAYVVLPVLFLLLAPPRDGRRPWAVGLGLFAGVALVVGGLYGAPVTAEGGLAGAVPGGLALVGGVLAILGAAGVGFWPARTTSDADAETGAGTEAEAAQTWPVLFGAAAAMRAVLGFLSIKERIPGLGFAVSVIYTPAMILGFSGLLAEALRANPRRLIRLGLVFAGLLFLMLAVLPGLVKDNGYVIVALPIAGMAAWVAWSRFGRDLPLRTRMIWSAPAAGLSVLLLGVLVAGAFSLGFAENRDRNIAQARDAVSDAPALKILEQAVDEDPTLLRVWMRLDPERLLRSGASEAEDLRVISRQLSGYTDTLFGRGYLTPANLTVLRPVHLNDNLSAIHLISPFGRITAAALLILLAVLPVALARRTRRDGVPRGRYEIAGFMALWVVFGVDAYIVLANLQLVPFTGRNVYLLAAASDSDLLEGTILIGLAYVGIAGLWAKDAFAWEAGLERIVRRLRPGRAS